MGKKEVKKAFESAENDLKEEEGEQLKAVIKATLEKLKDKKAERATLDKEIRMLKRDIDDFKAGRLDKIAERQEKDEVAREVSVFKIVKKEVEEVHHHHHHYDRWYQPYTVTWKHEWYPQPTIWGNTTLTADHSLMLGSNINTSDGINSLCITDTDTSFQVNCSVAKDFTTGAYATSDGTVTHL